MNALLEFANITMRIIDESDLSEYLPTLVDLESNHIVVIEGIPEDVDDREAIQNVIRRDRLDRRSFCFGVRSAPDRVTIGHYSMGESPQFMEIVRSDDGLEAQDVEQPGWWSIS